MSRPRFVRSTFYVQGMHCASCEIHIEKRLIKEESVQMVDAHLSKSEIVVEHQKGDRITPAYLNQIFSDDGYWFSDHPFKKSAPAGDNSACAIPASPANPYQALFFALILITGFLLLNKTGFTSLISVNSNTSLPVFLLFGLLAGFSSCAALVGGIILSVSKQWISLYGNGDDTGKKLEPHLLFNGGRVAGYALFGALLGLVGNFFKLSPTFTALMVIAVSLVMIILGLQTLGVRSLAKFQFRLPKFITGKVADESNFRGRLAPTLMGALTFFLPCGFTITAQALALASGNPITGALIMSLFALGTLPGLLAIGLGSIKLYANPKISAQFSIVAGFMVLFFALFNINNQLNLLGFPNLSNILASAKSQDFESQLIPLENGRQVIKMDASATGYSPSYIKVKAGIPVRWEITNKGVSGCTNAILAPQLFSGPLNINSFTTTVKEFTPPSPGTYRFSCWMGMISGTIEVVN